MALVAGTAWYSYRTDKGVTRFVRLSNNIGAQTAAGWGLTNPRPSWSNRLPPSKRMRRAFGVEVGTGRRGSIPVARLTSPLWTGAATTFLGSTTDGGTQRTYTVTGLVGEQTLGTAP